MLSKQRLEDFTGLSNPPNFFHHLALSSAIGDGKVFNGILGRSILVLQGKRCRQTARQVGRTKFE